MALSSASGAAAYSIAAAVKKLDLSEELAEIIRSDNTALLNRLGIGGLVATQVKHSWPEDELNPNTATVTEGAEFADDDTTLTVGTDEGVRFKIGTIFKFNEASKSEVCQVTAISGDDLTVVRGYGSTSGETHADGTTIMIIGHTKQEGWTPSSEDWTQEGLAKRLGVTRQTIISMEKGTYNPSLVLAFKIAHEFGMTIEDIFEYRDEKSES